MFLPKICVQWFYVLISSYLTLQKPPMVFPTFISSPFHHQAPPPPEGHLAIYRLPHPVCPRSRWILIDQWTKGTEVRALKFCRVTITRLHRGKKKHMLCISTCWRCKVPAYSCSQRYERKITPSHSHSQDLHPWPRNFVFTGPLLQWGSRID